MLDALRCTSPWVTTPASVLTFNSQPLSDNVGFGIGQPDVPGGNHDTWQRLDGHVVGGEVHRPLIDHDGPVRLVDVLFLKIVDAFGFYVERRDPEPD